MSSPGRKHASSAAATSSGGSRSRRNGAAHSHEPASRAEGDAPASTGLRGKVAAFYRATLGRVLGRKKPVEAPEPQRSHKSSGSHRTRGSSHRGGSSGHSKGHSNPKHSAPAEHIAPPADCRWVDTEDGLRALIEEVRIAVEEKQVQRSFIDTEADSLHHYTEKLCLIQLAVDDKFALIDTLALGDLTPLFTLLDRTEIWLHGADYDLTLLKKTYNWSPSRIYDTQIAARLCGNKPFGLAALVERHCGVVLCKSSQKADWSQRPLPGKMQAYAVDDVRYLGRLADIFIADLTAKNRLSWFEQSCANLRSDVLKRPDRDKEDAWRISGCGRLKPPGLAALREVWLWRDTTASERDVPPFKVLNNQQLLAMATEYESTGKIAHPPRWRPAWRDTLRAAVDRVRNGDPSTYPQQPKHKRRHISDAARDRIEELCVARDKKAEALGIEPSLLGSRATIEEVVLQPPAAIDEILMPWQREVLAEAGL